MNRLRSNSSCSVPSTPDQHTKFYRKRESSLTPTHLHPKFGIDRSNSTNLLNLTDKSAIATRGRSPRQRRGAICNEGSISFFNKFFLMLNDRISLLSNRGIRNGILKRHLSIREQSQTMLSVKIPPKEHLGF